VAAGAVAVLVVVGYWLRRSSLCRRRLMPLSRPSSIRPLGLTARGLCGRRRESKWPEDGGVRAMTHGLVCAWEHRSVVWWGWLAVTAPFQSV